MRSLLLFVCLAVASFSVVSSSSSSSSCNIDGPRLDCTYGSEQTCIANGCCWNPIQNTGNNLKGTPFCFKQQSFVGGYRVASVSSRSNGIELDLSLSDGNNFFGPDFPSLIVNVTYETRSRVHVKIVPSAVSRFEIPADFVPIPAVTSDSDPITVDNADFDLSYTTFPFGFAVTRKVDGVTLFNTTTTGQLFGGLVFQPQYMEISTHLDGNPYIYGLTEHVGPLRLGLSGKPLTFWARDAGDPVLENIYGTHPFYTQMINGRAHGVYLRNANGMDILVRPNYLQYRVIGGVLDFYIFTGPTPADVAKQYQIAVGLPHMPPTWSLGFHQCRWGYTDLSQVQTVVDQYAKNSLPLDAMWTDIDYMNGYLDFTTDPNKFPESGLVNFINNLHTAGQKYVQIIDPGIHNIASYAPYSEGLASNVFVHRADNTLFTGKVWPGITAFPSWFAQNTTQWWTNQLATYVKKIPISGVWIDMNEASNFCDGNCVSELQEVVSLPPFVSDPDSGYSSDSSAAYPAVNDPPYRIGNCGDGQALKTKAIDADAIHGRGFIEYDVHSLYGLGESIATKEAMESITGQRSFVLSRSTFSSSGHHVAHWLGDNQSTFESMAFSITGILAFNMAGVPLVGADICGFNGNTVEELCNRWMMLGAFAPFSRNHNAIGSVSQEPYVWPSVLAASKKALAARYSLLPYYVTLFAEAHEQGGTVARPLFFEFPNDANTLEVDKQMLIGPAILITPVLTQGATSVTGYFPPASIWYNFWDSSVLSGSGSVNLASPLGDLQVHVRGGFVIPKQKPALNTVQQQNNPYNLLIALDANGDAVGSLFVDDGVTLNVGSPGSALRTSYTVTLQQLSSVVTQSWTGAANLVYDGIVVLGVNSEPAAVTLDEVDISQYASWSSNVLTIKLDALKVSLNQSFVVAWN